METRLQAKELIGEIRILVEVLAHQIALKKNTQAELSGLMRIRTDLNNAVGSLFPTLIRSIQPNPQGDPSTSRKG